MANLILIRDLSESKGITIRELARQLEITEGAIQKMIATGSTNTSTIEKIASIFNVPVGYFFDTPPMNQPIANGDRSAASVYGNAIVGELTDKDKEIEHLKQLLKEKERTIQILMNK